MFFRNLTLFRFSAAVADDLQRLETALGDHRLRAPGPLEMFTRGFVSPRGPASDALTLTCGQFVLVVVGGDDRMLPASVVNDELQRKVQAIAENEGRKVGGRERRAMREDLLNQLLPRAFVRASRLMVYADLRDGWLVIDTASRKAAESALTQLREALGSFPAVPLAPDESPRMLMTDWLANGKLPEGLALGEECELRDPATATGAIVRARRQEMQSEEILEHLRNGKQVFQLALVFEDRISFVLDQDLVVRKLRFLDVVIDGLGDSENLASEQDATVALMAAELARLFASMTTWFALRRPADA